LVLLEAGNGSFSRLTAAVDFRALSAAIVSHFHLDHCADLFCLRHALKGARMDGSRTEPLTLFVPQEPQIEFERLAGDNEVFTVRTIESLPRRGDRRVASVGSLEIEFLPTRHSLPGYGVAVGDSAGERFVYSGDTACFPELACHWAGAGLLLCEATGLARDLAQLKAVHLTSIQAGELARQSGAARLVLTHFWPEYDPAVLAAEAAEAFGGRVLAAREGESYSL
jgi:ribonuclease BN (tRNA processing enzyme)